MGAENSSLVVEYIRSTLTLSDLYVLANYPVSYKVVNVLQACLSNFWKCSDMKINDRKRKTKKTLCSACMCRGLIWTFCMDEEVCLLLCMEGSLFPLPHDDTTMDVDICGHVTTRQWNLFATT